MENYFLPLMQDNISKDDINSLIEFLSTDSIPKLTNGPKVAEFEKEWSKWLGTKYSLFVNSGTAANQLTMLAIYHLYGEGEVIVPPLTWVSDIASVIQAKLKPVFCDINNHNLSFNLLKLRSLINNKTRAIFLTHVLGINALTQELIDLCKEKNILLIEDCCESHGATFKDKKIGNYGFASNFSFYFAHHMSTIEGGMICTNDKKFYETLRCMRSHGMIRESTDENFKNEIYTQNPTLNKDFIFIAPSYNFRSTELNAVLGLSQIKKLDSNNELRKNNFDYFIKNLDSKKYHTRLLLEGQCNYAFIVILNEANFEYRDLVESTLRNNKIEFRRGLSGGGSQIKQPYVKKYIGNIDESQFPVIEHIHNFSWYIGNYPSLEQTKLNKLLYTLNFIIFK